MALDSFPGGVILLLRLSFISQHLIAGDLAMRVAMAIALLSLLLVPAPAWAAGGEGGLINLDRSLIIQAVNFLILLFLLWRLLYRPLVAKMEERTQAIKKSLDEAQAARAEAQRQREEHAAKIAEAYAEAQAIRSAALKEASEEQRRLVEAARAEAARLMEAAKAEMDQDVRRARQELRKEVSGLAVAVAERLIKKSLREEDHRRIVEDALAGLDRPN
jgi:F-type H+-transporting ATPase subunit b